MRIFLIAILIVSLAGCESSPKTSDDGQPAESQSTGDESSDETPDDEDASTSSDEGASDEQADQPAESECFDSCMEANQMRSVPIEQIEDDCRAQCDDGGQGTLSE